MVLSNKKLKQKLRDSLTESLTAAEEAQNTDPKSQTQQMTFTSLLDSATRKPRVSKREKRRKDPSLREKRRENLSLQDPGGVKGVENGDLEKESEEVGLENGDGKKKKRKRKKDEVGLESGGSVSVENVVKDGEEKKKKKTKKKKRKKGKKAEEVEEGERSANGGSELGVMEPIMIGDSQEIEDVATKVYVGGIPYYSTEDDIRSYFEGCGTITEVDCMNFPESGKFRGIAIINFKTEAAAKRALAFDGSDMGGLFLKIQPYKSSKPKKASNFAPAIVKGYNRIYVGNLSWDISEVELRELFSGCKISAIRFGEDKETGEFRGYAHVDFVDSLSLNMALQLDQNMVSGRPVRVRCAVPKKVTESNSKSMPPHKEPDLEEVELKEADNTVTGAVSGKIRRRTCYECGEKGHLSSSCPKKQATDLTNVSAA